jgi:hypothetical protein
MSSTVHPPLFKRFEFDADIANRKARVVIPGVLESTARPIKSPSTGAEHRVGIVLPNGFEYGQNEVGRGWSTSSQGLELSLEDSYAHWLELHFNQHGRIH